MYRIGLTLAALAALAAGAAAAISDRWTWDLPAGIIPPPVPADNAMSRAKIDLGRRLFYDADLSIDGTMACANCHVQRRAFADSTATRPGVHGDPGRRNIQGLANVAYLRSLTWADPRLLTLEQQAAVPIFGDDPVEMGMKGNEAELARRLSADPCYNRMFAAAFPETGGVIDAAAVAKALAAFQRTMLSFDSPVDRHRRGEGPALSPAAMRGETVFAANCAACHSGQDFTDGRFHAIGGRQAAGDGGDSGLAHATGRSEDRGLFRTPSLRNVGLTGPYLHDGSAPTLADAIASHTRPPANKALAAGELEDLIAFMNALTDEAFVTNPDLAYPDGICEKYPE